MFERGYCKGPERHILKHPEDIRTQKNGSSSCAKCLRKREEARAAVKREIAAELRGEALKGPLKPPQPNQKVYWCRRDIHRLPKRFHDCPHCRAYSTNVRVLLQRNGNQVDVCSARRHHLPDMTKSVRCEICRQAKGEHVFSDAILMCGDTITFRASRAPYLDEMLFCKPCGKDRRVIDNRINTEETEIARSHIRQRPSEEDPLFSDAV